MVTRQLAILGLFVAAVSVSPLNSAQPDDIDPTRSGPTGNSNTPIGDLSDRQESWIYVQIPHFGMAPLQLVLEEGTPENLAWLDFGQPLDMYMPVPVLSPMANENNGAITVLMLPERCLGDFNDDGRVNLHDVTPFTIAYLNMDLSADLTRDSLVDVRDQILFLQLATIPCVNGW